MTTKTAERIDEMRERINRLETKAQSAGAQAKEAAKGRVAGLREHEASTRAAVREHADTADAKLDQLEANLKTAEQAVAAELAEDKNAFHESMQAYLQNVKELTHKLDAQAKEKRGAARTEAEGAVSDLRESREKLAQRLAAQREAAGERWRESKQSVATARAEVERKVDETLKKLR